MDHLMQCNAYKNIPPTHPWRKILGNNPDEQFEIAENIKKRQRQRSTKIENHEAGQPEDVTDSMAPGYC